MKVLMCHPISWKVNFRPLGLRSRPEEHRGSLQSLRCWRALPASQPEASASTALKLPALGRQRDVWAEWPRHSFLPPGLAWKWVVFQDSRKERQKESLSLFFRNATDWVCRVLCPGTRPPDPRLTVSKGMHKMHQVGSASATPPNGLLSAAPTPLATWGLGRITQSWTGAIPQASAGFAPACRSRPPAPPPPYPKRLERQILKLLAQRELLKRSQINMHVKLISCISWHQNKYLGNRTPSGHWEHMLELELID